MQPTKIIERVKQIAQRGSWAGKEIEVRVISWEMNGKRYRTRKEAIAATNS